MSEELKTRRQGVIVHVLHSGHQRRCACGHTASIGCRCHPERIDMVLEMWVHHFDSREGT